MPANRKGGICDPVRIVPEIDKCCEADQPVPLRRSALPPRPQFFGIIVIAVLVILGLAWWAGITCFSESTT